MRGTAVVLPLHDDALDLYYCKQYTFTILHEYSEGHRSILKVTFPALHFTIQQIWFHIPKLKTETTGSMHDDVIQYFRLPPSSVRSSITAEGPSPT